jgi:hypothetical protein
VFPTKFRLIATVLLTLGLGLGLTVRLAWADKPGDKPAPAAVKPAAKPGAPAADNPDKKGARKDAGPQVYGTVKSVDADKKTLTVRVGGKDKNVTETTYALAADTTILLPATGKTQVPGKLSDLSEGINVVLTMSADQKTVASITLQPPSISGEVKAVDASKNTITITVKDKQAQQVSEKTYAISPEAQVMLPGGEKGKPAPTAKLTDVTAGAHVNLRLTMDQKTVLGIMIQAAQAPPGNKGQK